MDELSYRIDSNGNKELAGYEQIKNFEASEQFQKHFKKPFK